MIPILACVMRLTTRQESIPPLRNAPRSALHLAAHRALQQRQPLLRSLLQRAVAPCGAAQPVKGRQLRWMPTSSSNELIRADGTTLHAAGREHVV